MPLHKRKYKVCSFLQARAFLGPLGLLSGSAWLLSSGCLPHRPPNPIPNFAYHSPRSLNTMLIPWKSVEIQDSCLQWLQEECILNPMCQESEYNLSGLAKCVDIPFWYFTKIDFCTSSELVPKYVDKTISKSCKTFIVIRICSTSLNRFLFPLRKFDNAT